MLAPPGQQVVERQCQGQEVEDEEMGAEDHEPVRPSLPGFGRPIFGAWGLEVMGS
jgi:hypothetical protein